MSEDYFASDPVPGEASTGADYFATDPDPTVDNTTLKVRIYWTTSSGSNFYKIFSFSDFMKHFKVIKNN